MSPPKVCFRPTITWRAALRCDLCTELQDIRSFFGGAAKGGEAKLQSKATPGAYHIPLPHPMHVVKHDRMSELLR